MSTMKSKAYSLLMMGLTLSGGIPMYGNGGKSNLSKHDLEREKREAAIGYKSVQEQRGVREWNIDGVIVMARNEKNAVRKANNKKKNG